MARRGNSILWGVSAALVLYGLLAASLGFFTIDEVIYLFAADTLRLQSSLILDNGYWLHPSVDLEWTELLTAGPNGLTSQYPPGSAVLWAPLMAVFGDRATVMVNVFATIATLFVTRALGRQLFRDERVALGAVVLFLFGTFALEYSFVIWPHMPAVLAAPLGFLLFLRALDRDGGEIGPAVLSGLVIGAGITIRVDTLLVLPAIAILTILHAKRPVRVLAAGALGLMPAFILLALANDVKFGTLNPISYGGKAGHTNAAGYWPFLVILVVALAALVVLRLMEGAPVPRRWRLVGAVAVAAILLAVPKTRLLVGAYAEGLWSLVVDARAIESPLAAIQAMPDGTVSFWGLSKKALGQSMPWLGLLGLLATPWLWRQHRRALTSIAVLVAIWSFPFLVRSWHGGMSSNMRYFLPLFPVLSVLGAALMRELAARAGDARALARGGLAGALLALSWTLLHPTGLAGAQQMLATWAFGAVLLASLAAGFAQARAATGLALLLAGVGVGMAVFNTAADTVISQIRREFGRPLSDVTARVPGKALIYTAMLRSALIDPEQIVAVPHWQANGPDEALIRRALEEGYRVWMPEGLAESLLLQHPGYRIGERLAEPVPLTEIVTAPG